MFTLSLICVYYLDVNWRELPVTPIIKTKHALNQPLKQRSQNIQSLDALSPLHRLLIVALILDGKTQHTTFTAREALHIFNNYASMHPPMKPVDDVQNIVEALLGYNLIKSMKENANPSMKSYQLKVTKDELMDTSNLGTTQKTELENYFRMNMTQEC
jgi:hypothetical protein